MFKNKKIIVLLLVVMLIGIFICGCGGSNGEGQSSEESEQETASEPFIVARSTDATVIDPGYGWSEGDIDVIFHVFDGLVKFKNDDLEVEPALAADWETSEDGLTWKFYLRKDVKFHDGTDFNADAVVYSFDRVLDENHKNYGVVKGGYSYLDYLMGDIIKDVKALDEYTVEITLNQKFAPFLTYMGYYSEFIVSPTASEKWGEQFPQNPVGTGPFVFERWNKNEFIELKANENYWGEKPKVDKLIFKVVPETSTRLMELQSGEVDAIKTIDPSQLEVVRNDENLELFSVPGANICYVGINTTREPFTDSKVRRALCHAIDMDKLVEVVYEGAGTRAINAIPPTVFGFDDTAGPYEYDPEKAKELLKEAGYPEGFEMQLFTILHARSYVAKPVQVAEVIAADLKAIGLNVEVKTYEYATLNELRKKLDYDVCIAGWYDVPYASNFLKTMALGGCKNGYEPPELVKLANKALGTYDRDEQLDYYSQLQHRLFEEAPIIPVAHNNYTAAIRSNVKGFELDIMGIVRVHNAYKE